MSLSHYLNSGYIAAANRLRGKDAPQKIVAYVESYDDIFFWNQLLGEVEDEVRETAGKKVKFEVLLPNKESLCRGKKMAMSNRLGPNMIACVDADYDYLEQGSTPTSQMLCTSPFVFHTYVYAIENFQCYAPTLQRVCVMATLNDTELFDFQTYLEKYSTIIYRLLVWNVWAYKYGYHTHFSLTHFSDIVRMDRFNLSNPDKSLEFLRQRCNKKMSQLQHEFPQGHDTYKPLMEEMAKLGVTPENAYLFMRGHDLFEHVVGPILEAICSKLRSQRETEISNLACHAVQKQNELASYQHSCAPWCEMLRKHDFFRRSSFYKKIVASITALVMRAYQEQTPPAEVAK